MILPLAALLTLAARADDAAPPVEACTPEPDPAAGEVERLRCPQGTLVRAPVPADADGRFDPNQARAALTPYFELPPTSAAAAPLPAEAPTQVQLQGQPADAWPLQLDSRPGWLIADPTSPSPRALGCLEAGAAATDSAWCRVALEALWGPAAGAAPTGSP